MREVSLELAPAISDLFIFSLGLTLKSFATPHTHTLLETPRVRLKYLIAQLADGHVGNKIFKPFFWAKASFGLFAVAVVVVWQPTSRTINTCQYAGRVVGSALIC